MPHPKLTPELTTRLEAAPEAEQWVIVELHPQTEILADNTLGRKEKVARLRAAFEATFQPVCNVLAQHQGEVLDKVWLNQTAKVHASPAAIAALAELDEVIRIDLPHQIYQD